MVGAVGQGEAIGWEGQYGGRGREGAVWWKGQ